MMESNGFAGLLAAACAGAWVCELAQGAEVRAIRGRETADDVCGSAANEAGERSADLAVGQVGDVLGDGRGPREEHEGEPSLGGADGWAVPVRRSPGKERQVTFWKEGESGGRFSPDGKQVLFVSAGWRDVVADLSCFVE